MTGSSNHTFRFVTFRWLFLLMMEEPVWSWKKGTLKLRGPFSLAVVDAFDCAYPWKNAHSDFSYIVAEPVLAVSVVCYHCCFKSSWLLKGSVEPFPPPSPLSWSCKHREQAIKPSVREGLSPRLRYRYNRVPLQRYINKTCLGKCAAC